MRIHLNPLPFKGVEAGFRIACDPPPERFAHACANAVCKTARVGMVFCPDQSKAKPIPLLASPLEGEERVIGVAP